MDRLERLAVFVAVAEHASFAGAARALGRTPPAVSRAVAELEEELRTRLLNRTTRAVALTEAGAAHLEAARRILAAVDAMAELRTGDADDPQGILHVTAPANFGRQHVLPLVAGFLARHPRVDVRLLLVDRVVPLVDEGLDLGVRLGALPDSSLLALRVGSVKRGVYASPAYLAAHGTPAAPQDLAAHRVVSCSAVSPAPDRWDLRGATVAVTPRLVVNTTAAAASAAAMGVGPTLLVSYQVAHDLESGRLVEILADHTTAPTPIHIVQPAGRFPPAKVRLFVDEIGKGLRARFG